MNRSHRRFDRRVIALVAASTLLATACGSTAQNAGSTASGRDPVAGDGLGGAAADSTNGAGLALPAADGLDASGGGVAGSGGGVASGARGGATPARTASGATTGGGSAPAGTAGGATAGSEAVDTGTAPQAGGPQGPGVTATAIKYGIVAVEDPNAGNNSAGINTANVHRIDETYSAVINDLNKRGGINSRKVELVVYQYKNSTTNEQLQAQACEKFTKDQPVFMGPDLGESALTCFEKAGMAMIGGGYAGYAQSQYAKYPHLLNPGAFALEHQVANTVRGLKAQEWMSGWDPLTGLASAAPASVGIVTFDIPVFRTAIEDHMRPALAAAGVGKVQVFYIRPNLNDGQADAQAAVLKFKREGVSHVTFLDNSGGLLELVFATNANTQGYFPRFGCDSGSCNQIVAGQMPQSSLRGAALVGWSPLNDVPPSKDYVLPGRARCEKIMVDAGKAPYSRNDLNVMSNVCEGVWFFEAAAKAAGSVLTADSLIQAASTVGASFTSPSTFAVEITPTKRAGANAYRTAAWDPTCGGGGSGCFIYAGPIRPFGG